MNGQESCQTSARVPLRIAAACFAIFLAAALLLQWLNGAWRAEFGSEPDEAAHYVTGLVIRDYAAAGFPGNPLRYAKTYYEHYPKVALGHWPPGFYLVQSAWSLIFSPTRVSILLLMAGLAASAALVMFLLLRLQFGTAKAVFASVLFLCFPLVQHLSAAVMTEIPVTLWCLVATIFWVRFLQKERRFDAVGFGIVASAAILTKQSAVCLAFVPLVSVLLPGKRSLIKNMSFWLSAAVVLMLTVPWNIATLKLMQEGMAEAKPSLSFTQQAIPFFAGKLLATAGFGISVLSLIGIVSCLRARERRTPVATAMFGLLVGVLSVCVLIPAGNEARHLVPALPSVLFFAWSGVDALACALGRKGVAPGSATVLIGCIALICFVTEDFRLAQKGYSGFRAVAESIVENPSAMKILASSDARGEGMFISEVAMLEKRPCRVVRRSSKDLAASSWSGEKYDLKTGDEQAVLELLKSKQIDYVVVDGSIPGHYLKSHHKLLQQVVRNHPECLVLEKQFPLERNGAWIPDAIQLYRFTRK